MSDTMQITATLIPVGRDFHARAGESIMVVAGLAVGVYSGSPPQPVADPPKLLESSFRAKPKAPRPPAAPVAKTTGRGGPSLSRRNQEDRLALRERVLEAIRSNPGITSTELNDLLGYARSDRRRWHVAEETKALMAGGVILGELVGDNPRLGRRFRAVSASAAKAA